MREDISRLLPEEADGTFAYDVFSEYGYEEFGGHYLVFSRTSYVHETMEWREVMTAQDMWDYSKSGRHTWAAECRCTACGSEWLSGWVGGGEILMYQDAEDSCVYPGVPEIGECDTVFVGEGDETICPFCEAVIKGVKKSGMRSGRTYQLLVCRVENVGLRTVLMYWLARRVVTASGDRDSLLPAFAVAIEEDGSLTTYSHCKPDGAGRMMPSDRWRRLKEARDPSYYKYWCYDAASHNLKGAVVWPYRVPDMAGETGEKTGLREYIEHGGRYPVQYLAVWRRHCTVENIMKSWAGKIAAELIDKESDRTLDQGFTLLGPKELGNVFDLSCPRPCDAVSMTPGAFRKAAGWKWDADTLILWREAVVFRLALPEDAEIFQGWLRRYGYYAMNRFVGLVTDGQDYTMDAIDRYLRRQNSKFGLDFRPGIGMLFDYHQMLYDERGGDVTPEEEYPNNLRYAHDTLAEKRKLGDAKKYARQFAEILKKWSGLEWTDGELCTVLPRTNADLVDEGRVLHHCVGGYGKDHAEGRIIVFVRHRRRPERSWYTLNIDTTGKDPHEIQLHGYHNEYAHGVRLRIPRKVREFVNRWEREILPEVFREVKAAEAAEKTKKNKEAAA